MNAIHQQHRTILESIAHRVMIERGLLPDFSAEALAELYKIRSPALAMNVEPVRDLSDLLWASIDNDDSRDLDQLTIAEAMPAGKVKILVAIADVDAIVKNGSAIDEHARHNTTSVYTAAMIFWQLIAPQQKMPPTKSNARSENLRLRCCSNRESESSSIQLSQALQRKVPGSGFSACR